MSHSHIHINRKQESWSICAAYCLLAYIITLCPMLWFTISELIREPWGIGNIFCLITGLFSMTASLLLPTWGMALLGKDFRAATTRYGRFMRRSCWYISGLFLGWVWCYIGADIAIYHHFGFHFNGLVLNLLTTRGGFEAMGLDMGTIFLAGFGLAVVQFLAIGIAHMFMSNKRLRRRCASMTGNRWLYLPWTYLPACALTALFITVGMGEFYRHNDIVNAADAYPAGIRVKMSDFMNTFGIANSKITGEIDTFTLPDPNKLIPQYPLCPIVRRNREKPMNIIWLLCESLRTEMLDEKYMPESHRFMKESGIIFKNHYSGGNGTRPSVFSMFYGLYATAWEPFLNTRRGAIFFDWLLEDQYQMLIQTSARFTYPEFDRTIFSSVPASCMVEEEQGTPWQRDVRVTDRLLQFINDRDPDAPIFGFIFFDSTHAPYSYPPGKSIFTPVMEEFSYTSLGPEMREQVYNRAANAAHHIDTQISRVLKQLRENDMLENTIIVITGDHGEEFYEKGRLGHNSSFVDEQIKTPFALYIPGQSPRIYEGTSHHCDIVPTLAPYMGISNPPSDYSVGGDLLNEKYQRDNLVVCGWRTAIFVNSQGKLMLPIDTKSRYAVKRFRDAWDNLATREQTEKFYSTFTGDIEHESRKLYQCLQEMTAESPEM